MTTGTKRRNRTSRKQRALRARAAASGDGLAQLAVSYDWFRAEQAAYIACGGGTEAAGQADEYLWRLADAIRERNDEVAARRRKTPAARR
jgi:hypothetical protein